MAPAGYVRIVPEDVSLLRWHSLSLRLVGEAPDELCLLLLALDDAHAIDPDHRCFGDGAADLLPAGLAKVAALTLARTIWGAC